MKLETISRAGKTYVLVEQGAFNRLIGATRLPPLPGEAADGSLDAVEYARASIARRVIVRREAAGLTQGELARRSGVRIETLNRLENARHTADLATLAKIDAALASEEKRAGAGSRASGAVFNVRDGGGGFIQGTGSRVGGGQRSSPRPAGVTGNGKKRRKK